jgi:hypothetical protein
MAKKKTEEAVYEYDANSAPVTPVAKPKSDLTKLNTLAVVSIAASATAFAAVMGVVTGHVALSQIKRSGEKGKGLAVTGVILGYAVIALWILGSLGAVALGIWSIRNGQQFGDRLGGHDGFQFGGFGRDDNNGGGFQLQVPQGTATPNTTTQQG